MIYELFVENRWLTPAHSATTYIVSTGVGGSGAGAWSLPLKVVLAWAAIVLGREEPLKVIKTNTVT